MVEQRQKGGSAYGGHPTAKPSSCARTARVCQTSAATSASTATISCSSPFFTCSSKALFLSTSRRFRSWNKKTKMQPPIENSGAQSFGNLVKPDRLDTIIIDSEAANRAWRRGRNIGRLLGATMRAVRFKARNFKIMSSLAFSLAMLPAASHAFTQEDQRRLCTGDVFRLCSWEIPDVERITACMRRQRANLSEGCRSVFGKPSDQPASTKYTNRY